MLQLTGAGKRFGHKLLFQDLDWLITTKDRVGLVGANGTGKSTVLKILAGMDGLDYGSLTTTKGISAGYLPQDGLALQGRTVFHECMTVFASLQAMEEELETLTHSMSEVDPASGEFRQIADRFHRVDSEFRARDGYAIEAQVGGVLDGLGFHKDDWKRFTEEFSGGWQMRIALAKLLLEQPNLLLLDEPTNHLDLEARNWLEQYLKTYPNAFVLISHDRYFLDVTITKIVELWNKRVHFYSGNYEKYLVQKADRRIQIESAYRNQRDRIDALELFINRFRATATKAKQVQSRIKELEKIERIEMPPDENTIHFSFPQPKPSGRIVAEFQGVSKSYGEKKVFEKVNFVIERGDRVALVGVNGAGKSTLIKLLSGAEPLSTGEYRLGHNVTVDYFAQDQYKELDVDAKLLDDLTASAPRRTQTELRSLLGCFLFSEDDVFKRIGVLSGGERNRYALAKMLLSPTNFILLDEPTNHLDMRAKRVFEIGSGEVTVFPGNYEDYLWRKSGKPLDLPAADLGLTPNQVPGHATPAAVDKGKRVNPMKIQKLKDRCAAIEGEIEKTETEIVQLQADLGNFKSTEETLRISQLAESRRSGLSALLAEWEQLSQELEAAGLPVG